jgi:hypothetical protein
VDHRGVPEEVRAQQLDDKLEMTVKRREARDLLLVVIEHVGQHPGGSHAACDRATSRSPGRSSVDARNSVSSSAMSSRPRTTAF